MLKKENSQTANNTKTEVFLAQKLKKPISKIIITAKPLMPPPSDSIESNKTWNHFCKRSTFSNCHSEKLSMSLRYLPLSSFKQEKNSFVLMQKWWNSKQGSWRMICTRHSSGWLCHVICRNGNGVREKRSVYIFSPHTLLNLISFNLPLLIRDTATDFQSLQIYVTIRLRFYFYYYKHN